MGTDPTLYDLEQRVEALGAAATPAEAFKEFLEAGRLVAPRVAMFLVRQGEIKGWGSVGYDRETARHQRGFVSPAQSGWLGEVASGDGRLARRSASGAEPDFGQPVASEAVAIALRVRSKTIAVALAERAGDEQPWLPGALGVLAHVVRLRLELDLANRKLRAAAGVAPTEPVPHEKSATVVEAAGAVEESKELSPVSPAETAEEQQGLDTARRFARLVATDIRLYNEEAVVLGRRDGDLAERLGEQLNRGKETFLRRHGDLGDVALDLLHEAYVEVLAGGKEELLPASARDPVQG